MQDYFFLNDQDLYGFRIPLEGASDVHLDVIPQSTVKKMVDNALQVGWQLDFLPLLHTPCIFIKTPKSIYHYFLTEAAAIKFRDDIMGRHIEDTYPLCFLVKDETCH